MTITRSMVLALLLGYNQNVGAFVPSIQPFVLSRHTVKFTNQKTILFGGVGTATNYSWVEEPFELEIHIAVPEGTRAKDITFRALPRSVDLRLSQDDGTELVLLNPKRQMRGRIATDGTFWEIHDIPESPLRQITVQIEKNHRTPKDDFDVIDYDWGGVYPKDDDEVTERIYEQPEELNVRDYAATLGVDIDNINMSLVDKTMFTSGLNMTRSTMDQLANKGLVQEITQQADGQEYTTNKEGDKVPYNPFVTKSNSKIPFIDTPSPWSKAIPIKDLEMNNGVATTVDDIQADTTKIETTTSNTVTDPIALLTVKRMKDILREQGLKISGSKEELQHRLRLHVQSMVRDKGTTSEDSTIIDV